MCEPRRDPGEEDAERISSELSRLKRGQLVCVTHYDGVAYVARTGVVSSVEPEFRTFSIARERISFDDVLEHRATVTAGTVALSPLRPRRHIT